MKKQQKKKNPFKVDRVRSIKLKSKAKQYSGQLKQLKTVVSEKVKSTNEQLSALEDVVRQTKKTNSSAKQIETATKNEHKKEDVRRAAAVNEYNSCEKNMTDNLDKLSNVSFME